MKKKNPNWTSETAPKGFGRSVKKYYYTITQVAHLKGVAIQTVRNHQQQGRVYLEDLGSVVRYLKGV